MHALVSILKLEILHWLYHTEFEEFKVELERRNLHKHLTNLQEGSIDVAVVKEFYANLYNPGDQLM